MKHFLLLLISTFAFKCLNAQSPPAKSSKNQLPDGVYLGFEEIRGCNPGLKRPQLYRSLYDTSFTILQWSRSPSLYYLDSLNRKVSVKRDSIILICEKGVVYVQQGGVFHKASLTGSVILFTEIYPKVSEPMAIVVTEVKSSARERLLDPESERVMDYSMENVVTVLKRDKELYDEFMSASTVKQRRKNVYRYLEIYNSRNPVCR